MPAVVVLDEAGDKVELKTDSQYTTVKRHAEAAGGDDGVGLFEVEKDDGVRETVSVANLVRIIEVKQAKAAE